MEQISLLLSPEEKAFEAIRPALEETLGEYRLNSDYISLEKRKGYFSILFKEESVVARLGGIRKRYLSVPTSALRFSHSFKSLADTNGHKYTKLSLSTFDDVKKHVTLLQEVLKIVIKRSSKEFDCCYRYLECSDAKQCIHPDPEFALQCGYQFILKEGRVFYGINRNVKS